MFRPRTDRIRLEGSGAITAQNLGEDRTTCIPFDITAVWQAGTDDVLAHGILASRGTVCRAAFPGPAIALIRLDVITLSFDADISGAVIVI